MIDVLLLRHVRVCLYIFITVQVNVEKYLGWEHRIDVRPAFLYKSIAPAIRGIPTSKGHGRDARCKHRFIGWDNIFIEGDGCLLGYIHMYKHQTVITFVSYGLFIVR